MFNLFNFSNFAPYKSPNYPFPILMYSTLMEPIFQVFIQKSEILLTFAFKKKWYKTMNTADGQVIL